MNPSGWGWRREIFGGDGDKGKLTDFLVNPRRVNGFTFLVTLEG